MDTGKRTTKQLTSNDNLLKHLKNVVFFNQMKTSIEM